MCGTRTRYNGVKGRLLTYCITLLARFLTPRRTEKLTGATIRNRTEISYLEGRHNSRYTIVAYSCGGENRTHVNTAYETEWLTNKLPTICV